jgi:hypothetical protein
MPRPSGAVPREPRARGVRLRTSAVAALLLALSSSGATGQARRAPVLLELPVSVRAAALGHAFPLGSVDANALFSNTAFAESLRGIAATAQAFGSRSSAYSAAGGMEWWGGSVGLGLQTASYAPDLDASAEVGGPFFGSGPEPVAETAATLAFSRRIRGIRFGAAGKLLEQRAGVERNSTVAGDLATALNVWRLNLGLSVQHIGPAMEVAGRDVPLPDRVTLGAAFSSPMPVGPIDLLAAAAVGRDTRGDFFGGGGAEVSYWPVVGRTFSIRAGARTRGADRHAGRLTLGAGFTGDRIGIDYAHESYGDRGDVHRVGLRWR